MLDIETKNRINTARDILVGKVPDPKSQVEQITIALIYKFMDDMDVESEELGGKRTFFVNGYSKYSWRKIFDPRLSGYELLNLYSEAIAKMDTNPAVPKLFRDIFKNAYLPYRDPETLKSFLKIINEFEYTHSEKLGDAFEYLLSVLGSQGDAGQFRTPRHIIDFMVAIIDPKKNETILDPACGTAGFLISSYRHIIKQNSSSYKPDEDHKSPAAEGKVLNEVIIDSNGYSGDLLTAGERKRLADNIYGYDISPDMVRLSLVNMYLHGIKEPHISEYDTLTIEDNWHHYSDVILANPPFMSPKGGIRPHKRFSVQSNRSEVLFVNYIAEHLTANGRAAVIVPEGIIFQSGNAYKQLRKMLVEEYLVGVISLPAGVFQPYSGVKTSILWLDKSLAKRTDKILFVKVSNDGYDLGAQRRAIKENDLFDALGQAFDFKKLIHEGSTFNNGAQLIKKSHIAAGVDYNLSADRYRENAPSLSKFSLVKLEDLFPLIRNGINVEQSDNIGRFRVTRIQTISSGVVNLELTKWTNAEVKGEYFLQGGDILMSHINSIDHLAKSAIYNETDTDVIHGINLLLLRADRALIYPEYAIRLFKSEKFIDIARSFAQRAVNQASIRCSDIKAIQIPVPPLTYQEEIVSEIESYQKIIDGARMVVENYKPRIEIDPEWEMIKLGELCKIRGGYAFDSSDYVSSGAQLIRMGNVKKLFFDRMNSPCYLPAHFIHEHSSYVLRKGDILISMTGTIGKEDYGNTCMVDHDSEFLLNQRVGKFIFISEKIDRMFMYYYSITDNFRKSLFAESSGGVRQANISSKGIENITIHLPPIKQQLEIVEGIKSDLLAVEANKKLIENVKKKIQNRIAKVWGEQS